MFTRRDWLKAAAASPVTLSAFRVEAAPSADDIRAVADEAGGKYDKVIENATKFVKSLQDDSDPKDVKHGGVGYDAKSRPDLSNTQYMVESLLAAGVPKDDPAIKKALVFISRSQNLKSEFN